jgi:hypothetical protein
MTQGKIEDTLEKISQVVRHIENVRDNTIILGTKLVERGDIEEGLKLIALGHIHDVSKFSGIEWEHLDNDATKSKLELAVNHHSSTNPHHPEYWGGITKVPHVYLAELVCDWAARASEFGTSLRGWIEEGAAKRFGYKKGDKVYRDLMELVDLLCDKPFKQK